ncbi:MAG: hypothetical protein ABSF71_18930 [Terriglobia bacterium]|jgi:hypothetical protein
MNADSEAVFAELKSVFGKHTQRLSVKVDTPIEYTLHTKRPSPLPQHKGHPMYFGCVRLGKAYVSFHLMPLYMNPTLTKTISPALKKRMQGKTCFNFKTQPDPGALSELKRLTAAGFREWAEKKWA